MKEARSAKHDNPGLATPLPFGELPAFGVMQTKSSSWRSLFQYPFDTIRVAPFSALSELLDRMSAAGPFVVALAIGGLLAWRWWYRRSSTQAGPKRWPWIGSTMEIVMNWDRLHDWMLEQFSDDARTLHLATMATVSPLPSVYTVDPANVEHILKTNFANYPKGYVNCERLRELFGMGIFAVDGHLWREQRRVTSYEFSSGTLRDFSTAVFRDYACKLVSIISSTAEPFDLQDLCMRMTLDTTSKVGFGVELRCLLPSLPDVPFARCFDDANCISFYRFGDPLWRLKRALNVGTERRLKECIRVIDEFTFNVISSRRREMAAGKASWQQSDLLSRFIDLCGHGGVSVYTDKDLRDMILNFLVAGRDTTAVTLSWFFYVVTCHPEVAHKIVQELSTVTQRPAHTGSEVTEEAIVEFSKVFTYETLEKLHYLHAALSETLRLYPAVPIEGKEALEDDLLPDGTFVKKGSHTGYVPYSMGRMKFLWGNDALEFKPERWLDQDGLYQPQPLFKFTAFQAGPRTCLGKESAYLQMKMTAALVLRFFALHMVPGYPIHYRTMIVLNMQHGLRVTATPRSSLRSSDCANQDKSLTD